MSLNTNITNLQEILNKVNNLPEAGPSAPESTPLILNKVDSMGEIQGDGTVSETFTHTFEFAETPDYLILGRLDGNVISNNSSIQYPINAGIFRGSGTQTRTFQYENINQGNTIVFTPNKGELIIKTQAHSNVINNRIGQEKMCLIAIKNDILDMNSFFVPTMTYSCYLKNTLITLANNQTKKVQDITYQDNLLVWNFDNGCYTSAKPLWIKQSQIATQYYHCVFEDNSTLDLVGRRGHAHRIFCLDTNRFEYANDCIGKTIMTQNGPMKLLSCDIVEDNVEFYNIITDYHMNCFANKVLTSTGFSNIYPIENMKYIADTNREIIPIEAFANCPEEYYYGMRLGEQVNYTMERMNEKIQNMATIALPKGE